MRSEQAFSLPTVHMGTPRLRKGDICPRSHGCVHPDRSITWLAGRPFTPRAPRRPSPPSPVLWKGGLAEDATRWETDGDRGQRRSASAASGLALLHEVAVCRRVSGGPGPQRRGATAATGVGAGLVRRLPCLPF